MTITAQYLGETWTLDFELNDDLNQDLSLSGTNVVLTLADLDHTVLLTKSSLAGGITITDPVAGRGTCSIQPNEQSLFKSPWQYILQIKVVLQDGAITSQVDEILPLLKLV